MRRRGVTEAQAQLIDGWRRAIVGIAVQEMLHLGLASNLLTAIGEHRICGARIFRRAIPTRRSGSTSACWGGEAISRRFCCFELPPEIQPTSKYAHWKDICAGESNARAAVIPLLPQPIAYQSIGALYGLIAGGFQTLYPDDASKLFIGSQSAQTASMWQAMMAVTTRAEAVKAIDLILRHGEGPTAMTPKLSRPTSASSSGFTTPCSIMRRAMSPPGQWWKTRS